MKLRKLVINDRVHVSLGLVPGDGEEGGGPLKWHVPVWDFCWEVQLPEKKCDDDHRENNFFINNSVEVLIPHKEVHRGLLKLHLHLGGIPENYRNTLPLHTVDKS